ncbi:hypothetical protein CEXT_113221 [Caerostris extrusa]|uniref:Uncharacterized protein n=1 Tax=Caerostris extrusa TaxID=172846 RepID=A0AAV4SFW1_CAEEX|nr:hypothetical protein CEXT_113221 [Caerostris extrusa]
MDCGRNCIIVKGMKGLLKVVFRVGQKGLLMASLSRIKLPGKTTTLSKGEHNEAVLWAGHGAVIPNFIKLVDLWDLGFKFVVPRRM